LPSNAAADEIQQIIKAQRANETSEISEKEKETCQC
jgi:hypothetical protein